MTGPDSVTRILMAGSPHRHPWFPSLGGTNVFLVSRQYRGVKFIVLRTAAFAGANNLMWFTEIDGQRLVEQAELDRPLEYLISRAELAIDRALDGAS